MALCMLMFIVLLRNFSVSLTVKILLCAFNNMIIAHTPYEFACIAGCLLY